MRQDRILAAGLFTRNHVDFLGPAFDRIWPVEPDSRFGELLSAIDQADRRIQQHPGRRMQ